MATKHREFVYRDGKPSAVILDTEEYREILERLEDAEDLRALRQMRARPLRFRRLEDFLSDHSSVRSAR
jgi:PHD/YefM family antitoxin component YafN of YafNO toxin-antitoxin module